MNQEELKEKIDYLAADLMENQFAPFSTINMSIALSEMAKNVAFVNDLRWQISKHWKSEEMAAFLNNAILLYWKQRAITRAEIEVFRGLN